MKPTSGNARTHRTSDHGDDGTLRRLTLEAPYGPAAVMTNADPAQARVTYKVRTLTLGLVVTVEPEYGGGHTAIPRGVDLELVCNGIGGIVTIPDIGPRGEDATVPDDLIPGAPENDGALLAAVLRAVIRDWANRPDAERMRWRAATWTAAGRVAHAQHLLAEHQRNLTELLIDLNSQYHTIRELRGLAADHRNDPRPPDDEQLMPIPTPHERATFAAYAVAAHAGHTGRSVTAADLYTPAVANDAVTSLLVDLHYLLHQIDIDPGELTSAASDIYDIECTEGPDRH